MSRKRIVVGKIRDCDDHFHLEYECAGCGEPSLGPMNTTRFETFCSDTGQEFIVVGFPSGRSYPKAPPNTCR
jgi:hypothetical protein